MQCYTIIYGFSSSLLSLRNQGWHPGVHIAVLHHLLEFFLENIKTLPKIRRFQNSGHFDEISIASSTNVKTCNYGFFNLLKDTQLDKYANLRLNLESLRSVTLACDLIAKKEGPYLA